MPIASIPEKLRRMLTLLYGLRDRIVRRALLRHGLDKAEIARGWQLFYTAARGLLSEEELEETDVVAGALAELDAWENTWFPIVRATLGANFPAVADQVFLNLGQATGREVILTVTTLLDRVEGLGAAAAGTSERNAFALLERRGLDPAVRRGARDLLAAIQKLDLPVETTETPSGSDPEADLRAAWTWYLEWSEIARVSIPRKDLRIRLGVSSPTEPRDEPSDSDEPTDPGAPRPA